MRKIIQITSVGEDLFALCDDGTVWKAAPLLTTGSYEWRPLPELPQPTEKLLDDPGVDLS